VRGLVTKEETVRARGWSRGGGFGERGWTGSGGGAGGRESVMLVACGGNGLVGAAGVHGMRGSSAERLDGRDEGIVGG